MPRTLTLEQITIPEPCPADWNAMHGDASTRFCDACEKHVFNLSARSRRDAEAVLAEHCGHLCVQMTLDRRGRVITQDGPRAWPVVRRVWPLLSIAIASIFGLAGCIGGMIAPSNNVQRTGGRVAERQPLGIPLPATRPTPSTQPTVIRGDIDLTPTTRPTTNPVP